MRWTRAAHKMAPLAAVIVTMTVAEAAQGAIVTFDRSCYSPGEPVTVTGSGFSAGAQISDTLTLTETGSGQALFSGFAPPATTDALGAFTRKLEAPRLVRAVDRTENALSAYANIADPAAESAFVQWTLSDWQAEISAWRRGRANPRGWMVLDTYGWTSAASTLYAHYYRNLKRVKSVRIGALTGPCGDLRKRVRQFPFANVKAGLWKVYFTGTLVHDKRQDPSIHFNVRVPK